NHDEVRIESEHLLIALPPEARRFLDQRHGQDGKYIIDVVGVGPALLARVVVVDDARQCRIHEDNYRLRADRATPRFPTSEVRIQNPGGNEFAGLACFVANRDVLGAPAWYLRPVQRDRNHRIVLTPVRKNRPYGAPLDPAPRFAIEPGEKRYDELCLRRVD